MSNLQPASPQSFFKIQQRDILAELLKDKRSPNTRRAYAKDLAHFFKSIAEQEPTPQIVAAFLKLERATALALTLQYKAQLIEQGLSEATVNRRLAAIKSLVKFAQDNDQCEWSLEAIKGERLVQYRDTSGIDQQSYAKLLQQCDRSTLLGKRNYALLLLLWSNVLRRGEIAKLSVGDFSPGDRSLKILGKGRGTQAETVSLNQATVEAIANWLEAWKPHFPTDPLFVTLSHNGFGQRISGNALYNLVCETAIAAGIEKHMSPHRIRHSGITAALDATGGDVRKVQKLSRHKRLDTLMIYDDSRKNAQGEVTDLLSKLLDPSELPDESSGGSAK